MAVTDGTQAPATVDPVSSSDTWETMLQNGFEAAGIDPMAPLDDAAHPAPDLAPQGATTTESEPAKATAPADAPAGDVETTEQADDPLAGAAPFSFTHDGQTKSIDGTYRIPGEGLVVPEDRVAQFEQVFQRAESADAQIRELQDRHETWQRMTAWPSKDAQGNAITLTGQEGYEAQRVLLGRTLPTLQILAEILSSDEAFGKLVKPVQMEDGSVVIVRDPDQLAIIKERADNAAYRAEVQVRQALSKAMLPPPPAPPAVTEYAKPTIQALMAQHKLELTTADQEFLAAQFPQYVNPDGKSVSPAFVDVLKDRAAIRAEHTKTAAAANTAAAFNNKMSQARQPQKRQTVTPSTTPPAAVKQSKAAAWDSVLAQAMAEIEPV